MPIYQPTPSNIEYLAVQLKANNLVAIPTETVYGLAASALSHEACQKIFTAKQRPPTDPLIVHVHNIQQIQYIAQIPYPKTFSQLTKLWPGPLTIILPKLQNIPEIVTAGGPNVGIRIPKCQCTLELLEKSGPLAAPSANKFGHISPVSALHCASEFIDLDVLDGGNCEIGIESTVLEIIAEGKIYVFRRGGITQTEILEVVEGADIEFRQVSASAVEVQTAPGQLLTHYAIKDCQSVFLAKNEIQMDRVRYLDKIVFYGLKIGIINYGFSEAQLVAFQKKQGIENPVIMSISDKPEKLLYSSLRQMEDLKVQYCVIIPDLTTRNGSPQGIYASVFDRVFRSCSGTCFKYNE
ncbi:Threonylcarbamoyl-AMP synthase [Spironucleus salmonicida]|uniref:Threonylcarbamoyl-AMP synthase n=1 Tax=Spironucleus salmonicida TaxID=348837 RepID=V6LYR6_9EUKA|nr:Threonylcarbamoyl-AMP synthase [Spironucleus salmonicida]|eukprot:EST45969.1 Sua5/Yci0/YrdC/YwlC family protein [Spironucleus salmonicida]